jgi:hypothetical protein
MICTSLPWAYLNQVTRNAKSAKTTSGVWKISYISTRLINWLQNGNGQVGLARLA